MDTMKSKSLTPKQEKFSQLVASGESLSDAYRGAFNAGNSTSKTINEKASKLMAEGKVTARVDVLRAEHMKKMTGQISYEYADAMRELNVAIEFAKVCKSPGAFVAALNLKQKISGLHVEERRNDRSPVAGMSADRVKAALEALAVIRKAKEIG